MNLAANELEFLATHASAAMVTTGADGRPKVARVAVAMVDGKLWSSGTQDRVRTRRLRRDPRCTVFVFDGAGWSWLSLDTTVAILEGPDAPAMSLRLFRTMQQRPTGPISWFGQDYESDDFERLMVDEQRLIYEFDIERSYGMV